MGWKDAPRGSKGEVGEGVAEVAKMGSINLPRFSIAFFLPLRVLDQTLMGTRSERSGRWKQSWTRALPPTRTRENVEGVRA